MRTLKILNVRDPRYSDCPSCKENKLTRSRARSNFEQFIKKYTFLNIYRCKNCGWRGKKSNLAITKDSFKAIGLYITLAIVAAMIVRFVLTKFIIK